ncbi:hypothetical protein pdam_00019424, partial [Pocillopora damicornis]
MELLAAKKIIKDHHIFTKTFQFSLVFVLVRSSPLHYDSPIISKNPNGIKSLLENDPQVKSQPTQYKISKIRVRAVISIWTSQEIDMFLIVLNEILLNH